ncbi:MAG TPA: biotin/lipoate A/B protein ligase family protein [Xanthobacteraceae bacterium]|nr:biotin/lipoate A/B protein ligase family protein [Xanthobacteraceae bacterium]
MTALRLIRDEGFGGRGNVAMTAAMVELRDAGRIPDTLRLYRYPRCVLLGRNQSAVDAVDLTVCNSRNIETVRRITGGGAIYMDEGVVTFDLLTTAKKGVNAANLSARVCTSIAQELAGFGISADFRPENDVVAGGKKVFGASGFASGAMLLYQGSLMVSPDLAAMGDTLGIPDMTDRVTTVAGLAKQAVTIEEVKDLLGRAIGDALGRPLENGVLSPDEIELQNKFVMSEFAFGSMAFPELAAA